MNTPDRNRDTNRRLDEDAERLFESSSLANELSVEPRYAPNSESPPIDYGALRALVRGELDETSASDVMHLVAMYRPWNDAWRAALMQDAARPPK